MDWFIHIGKHRNRGRYWYGMDNALLESIKTKGDIGTKWVNPLSANPQKMVKHTQTIR